MVSNNTNFFERSFEKNEETLKYWELLNTTFNKLEIINWKRKMILELYDLRFENVLLSFIFQKFKQWIMHNQSFSKKFINDLEIILSNTIIRNYLNIKEQNYINNFKAIVFAKNRNIKKLIVSFELNKNEEIWYSYEIMAITIGSEEIILNRNILLYLSNQQIICIYDTVNKININYDDIEFVKLSNKSLVISTKNNKIIVYGKETENIYVSIERIGRLTKRFL